MAWMKDVVRLDVKVVNITFTPQGYTYIYELLGHKSTITNMSYTYFFTILMYYKNHICPNFVSNVASFRYTSHYLTYKHMYYITKKVGKERIWEPN
jgi:hypothetical protein